jgi:DNA-binding MurR/RpiR family transcriptional regulator
MMETKFNKKSEGPFLDVIELINSEYHYFSNTVKKVADFILANPRGIIHLPITELAEKTGVSEYTIMKLCKNIGLSGYQELKVNLSKQLVKPLENIHQEVQENDVIQDISQKLANSYMEAIKLTKDSVDNTQIELAVEAINEANQLEFYGMGTSASVAKDAFHKFFRVGIHCRYFEDGHMQAMSASMLKPKDVVIVISNSGSTKDLIDALKEAKQAGATTICISSQPNSPITKLSDIKIVTQSMENYYRGEPMENRIAQIYVIDLLFVSLALKRKEVFLSNLNKTRNSLTNKKL